MKLEIEKQKELLIDMNLLSSNDTEYFKKLLTLKALNNDLRHQLTNRLYEQIMKGKKNEKEHIANN